MSESYQRNANSGDVPNQPVQAPSKTAEEGVSEKASERPDVAGSEDAADKAPPPDQDYPEQKHAGAVGYGPNYAETHGHVTVGERIAGLKEELKGHITRNPDVVKEGHDKRTGEAKRRAIEQEEAPENMQKALRDAEKKEKGGEDESGDKPAPMKAEEKAADERAKDESTKSPSTSEKDQKVESRHNSEVNQGDKSETS